MFSDESDRESDREADQECTAPGPQKFSDELEREADLYDLLIAFHGLIRNAGGGVQAAKAAELRAAVLTEAEAQVMVCKKELDLLDARRDLRYFREVPGVVISDLEDRVRQTRADESVAKAKIKLLTAELKALQLTAELKAEMKALQLRKSDQVQASESDDATSERAVEQISDSMAETLAHVPAGPVAEVSMAHF